MPTTQTHSVALHVHRAVLDNGLTVLIKESHSSPVAAVAAHVNVGYFNEPDRWNGISHVIEHMLFKGTRKRPGKEQIAEDVRRLGGDINAGTYYEDTDYHITVPSANLAPAVEILSDVVRGSLIGARELAKEIEVIIQESKQKRDNPGAMLIETMYARSYDRHRIRRWRIGEDETLRALRREDLLEFMEGTYRPENMVVVVVGDVETGRTLETIERYWADMPRGKVRKEESPQESEHQGFRYERMAGEIHQRLMVFGFHAPEALSDDTPALTALDNLLGDGRSSRLYRSLKEERQLANSVWADYEGFARLGIFALGADTVADDPLAAERAMFEEVGRLVDTPVGEEELQRVKTRLESRRVYRQEEVLGMARSLAWYQSLGDYRLMDEMAARTQAVSGEQVQAAAARYLNPDRATLVEYLPAGAAVPKRTAQAVRAQLVSSPPLRRSPAPPRAAQEDSPIERTLPNGATLMFRRRRDLPLVALHVLFTGGRRGETPQTAGLTNLTLKSMLKGTESYSAEEIAERVESLGSSIGLVLAPDYCGFSMKLLADRLADGLPILREVISKPTYPAGEVAKEKESIYAEIRRTHDSMSSYAMELFNAASYGDTPYGLPAAGAVDAVAGLEPIGLREWHARWIRGGRAVIGAVGDIEEDRLADLLAELVLPGGDPSDMGFPAERIGPGELAVTVERQQTAAVMGFPGADQHNEDRHALDLVAEITSGLAGRFFQAVRGENALAYAVSSFHRTRMDAGIFGTYTATSPENEVRAREIILRECERLAREPVGDEELASAKVAIRGAEAIHTQTFSAQAGELALHRLYGLPLDETERYLARIEAITPEELQAISGRYLRPEQTWLGIVRGGGGK